MDPRLYHSAKTGNTLLLIQLLDENPGLVLNLTPHENTPLHIAARFGNKNVVAEIYNRQKSLLTWPNLDGDTPLHVAARAGHFTTVFFIVEEILSSSFRDIENRPTMGIEMLRLLNKAKNTALHEAVRNRHLRVVEFLIKVYPELAGLVNNVGESPLYFAAREGMLEIVNWILTAAPSSACGGSDGQTALHAAVVEGHFDVIESLVRAKPQLVKETDHHGRTPLYSAASSGDHRTVQRLLQLDTATVYTSDKEGQSPLHIAASKGHSNIIKVIVHHCPDSGELLDLRGRNILHAAVLSGKLNVVRYVLETKELEGLIDQSDNEGNTPLHLATMERKTLIVRYLMWDKRADPRAINNMGRTAVDHGNSFGKIFSSESEELEAASKMQTYKQMGHTLLMVATLIATVTFAAAFTMPGGFNNDVGPNQGLALLQSSGTLEWFIISDSIAMSTSMIAACVIFWGSVIAKETYLYYFVTATLLMHIALQSSVVAFTAGVTAVMANQPYISTMCYAVGSFFHVSNCLFVFYFASIFSQCELYQFLVYRMCKLKSKFINR
ncbi:protein ACCELERATED CELL DEATH 6-like [Rhododendron vialii]|uniref:protein ACCELERATED CELL DEATH 6-like n=1 Tax=Rhododendron vialii TaxID=182163 RepID=UPI00265FA96B|nr:protein ACCELERATED CELL DEATH 6-like [Rhododendron vialii]